MSVCKQILNNSHLGHLVVSPAGVKPSLDEPILPAATTNKENCHNQQP